MKKRQKTRDLLHFAPLEDMTKRLGEAILVAALRRQAVGREDLPSSTSDQELKIIQY